MAQQSQDKNGYLNFFRLASVLVTEGTLCLRHIFDYELRNANTNVAEWLENAKLLLEGYMQFEKGKPHLIGPQWSKLYPTPRTVAQNSSDFDISLLSTLLSIMSEVYQNQMSCHWYEKDAFQNIQRLRSKRNELYGHAVSCFIETEQYNKSLNDVTDILLQLAWDQSRINFWATWNASDSEVEILNQKIKELKQEIQQLTESDAYVMQMMMQLIIETIGCSNPEITNKLKYSFISSSLDDTELKKLGLLIRGLVEKMSSSEGLAIWMIKLLSNLHDTKFIIQPTDATIIDELIKYFEPKFSVMQQFFESSMDAHSQQIMDHFSNTFLAILPLHGAISSASATQDPRTYETDFSRVLGEAYIHASLLKRNQNTEATLQQDIEQQRISPELARCKISSLHEKNDKLSCLIRVLLKECEGLLPKPTTSFVLYMLCSSLKAVDYMWDITTFGHLHQLMEDAIREQFNCMDLMCVHVFIEHEDYSSARRKFELKSDPDSSKVTTDTFAGINDWPLELLHHLLLRTFVKLFVDNDVNKNCEAARQAYTTLVSVCSKWWQTVTGRSDLRRRHWFRNRLKRHLRDYTVVLTQFGISQSVVTMSSGSSAVEGGVRLPRFKLARKCESEKEATLTLFFDGLYKEWHKATVSFPTNSTYQVLINSNEIQKKTKPLPGLINKNNCKYKVKYGRTGEIKIIFKKAEKCVWLDRWTSDSEDSDQDVNSPTQLQLIDASGGQH